MKLTDEQKSEIINEEFKKIDSQVVIQAFISYFCRIMESTNASDFKLENKGDYKGKRQYIAKITIAFQNETDGNNNDNT